jgi:hypothetical protein
VDRGFDEWPQWQDSRSFRHESARHLYGWLRQWALRELGFGRQSLCGQSFDGKSENFLAGRHDHGHDRFRRDVWDQRAANTVSISNSATSISESNATPVVFTINRNGNTASPLFASFLFTGTASNGVDHTVFPTSITFPAGVTTTNINITISNDTLAEFSENSHCRRQQRDQLFPRHTRQRDDDDSGRGYSGDFRGARTVESRLLEGFDGSRVAFQLTRKGLLTPALSANIAYSGTASQGTDFTGPPSVAIGANAVNATFSIALSMTQTMKAAKP